MDAFVEGASYGRFLGNEEVAVLFNYCCYDDYRQKTGLNEELKLPSLEKRLFRGCGYFSGEGSLT